MIADIALILVCLTFAAGSAWLAYTLVRDEKNDKYSNGLDPALAYFVIPCLIIAALLALATAGLSAYTLIMS